MWRHVELAPRHPFELQAGDCELVEQFRDTLLPMFVTRNVNNQINCVPHQESGSNFSLSFDVLAPLPPANAPAAKGAAAKGTLNYSSCSHSRQKCSRSFCDSGRCCQVARSMPTACCRSC